MDNQGSKNNSKIFNYNLGIALKKLGNVPQSEKTDELSATLYCHKNFLVRKTFIDRFKKAYGLASFKDKSILDYGCGSGIFLQALSPEINQGTGVDLDIEVAKKIISAKNIVLNEIKSEKDIESFSNIDIITSFDVLEHIPNLEPLLDTFKKILAPEGKLIISGPTENFLYRLARKITRFGVTGRLLGEEEHVSNILDIKELMIKRGFTLVKNVNLSSLFHITLFTVNRK